MPFGVDLSNVEFKNPSDSEQGAGQGDRGTSSDAAPSGESFKGTENPESKSSGTEIEVAKEAKEYSKEELEKMLGLEAQAMTQPVQDTKKFDDNFGYDIATLLKDPSQFQKFSQIYPAHYVERAKQILLNNGVNPFQPKVETKPQDPWQDPKIQDAMRRLEMFEQQQKESRVQAIVTKLDTAFEKLGAKYPDADKNVINWYLQGLGQKGISVMDEKGNLRTQVLEKLFKADHDSRNKAYEAKYRAKVDAQKKMNLKSKDMGSGGSLGSLEGKQPRTIKEATSNILKDLQAAR